MVVIAELLLQLITVSLSPSQVIFLSSKDSVYVWLQTFNKDMFSCYIHASATEMILQGHLWISSEKEFKLGFGNLS